MGQKSDIKDPLLSKSVIRWAIALAIGGTIATGIAAIYLLNQVKLRPTEVTSSPTETPAIEAVTALGRLEPVDGVIYVSAPMSMQGDSRVEQLLVSKGDWVRAEQVIAIMSNRDQLQRAVEVAQRQVDIAKANLARIKAGAKAGAIQAQQATINRLQAELKGEEDAQQTKINRLTTQVEQTRQAQQATIQAQQSTVRRLEAELRNAQEDWTRYQQLVQDGAISQSELESRRLKVETNLERLSEAQANLSEIQANQIQALSTLNEELEEAKVNRNKTIAVLEAQINEAKARLDEIKEVPANDIKKAEAEVETALADVQKAQEDLQLAYVKAPFAGKILNINTDPSESVNTANRTNNNQSGIVSLGKTDQMKVVAEVYESDISKVRVGQRVMIKSESKAFEGELRGTVSQIGLEIAKKDVLDTDPAAAVDARVVEVDIRLNSADSKRVENLTNSKVIVQIFL